MSIANHVWGECIEQDIVWSHVAGMDSARAGNQPMIVWQGYFDETEKDDWFILAGYLAPAKNWVDFTQRWRVLARRFGRQDEKGRYYVHMMEQANRSNAPEYLSEMRQTIHDHISFGFAIAMRPSEFKSATKRVLGWEKGKPRPLAGDLIRRYYLYLFDAFLDTFAHRVANASPPFDRINNDTDRVMFFFDQNKNEGIIAAAWEDFKNSRIIPTPLSLRPIFEDDKDFLPLQAADFFAYWLRRRITEFGSMAAVPEGGRIFPFGDDAQKVMRYYVVQHDEEEIVSRLMSVQHDNPGLTFLDRKSLINTRVKNPSQPS